MGLLISVCFPGFRGSGWLRFGVALVAVVWLWLGGNWICFVVCVLLLRFIICDVLCCGDL